MTIKEILEINSHKWQKQPSSRFINILCELFKKEGINSRQVYALMEELTKRQAWYPSISHIYNLINEWGWSYDSKTKKKVFPKNEKKCENCKDTGMLQMINSFDVSMKNVICDSCAIGKALCQKYPSWLRLSRMRSDFRIYRGNRYASDPEANERRIEELKL